MIISHGRHYIFVHIPKTGGTSMALALEARAMKDDIMLGDTPKALKRRHRVQDVSSSGRLWKHSTLADIEGLVPVENIESYFTFTLVRNPWDRMVSYYHWLKDQSFDHVSVEMAKSLNFPDFTTDARTLEMFQSAPARSYMTSVDGAERCDAYIRIEAFETDVEPLVGHLGFPLVLPRMNSSDRDASYQTYYTSKAVDAVAICCAEDIARFHYGFE